MIVHGVMIYQFDWGINFKINSPSFFAGHIANYMSGSLLSLYAK